MSSEPRPVPGSEVTCAASGARRTVTSECPVMALTGAAPLTWAAQTRVHRHGHQVPDVDCHVVTCHEGSVRVLMVVTLIRVTSVTILHSLWTLKIIVTGRVREEQIHS